MTSMPNRLQSDAELPVDGAGSNCDVVIPVTFPEQHRTALLAEPSLPRIAGAVPFEAACFGEPELFILRRGRRHIGAGPLATLTTVAPNHRPELSRNLECDGPAEARPGPAMACFSFGTWAREWLEPLVTANPCNSVFHLGARSGSKRAVTWLSGFEVGPTLRHATMGAKCQADSTAPRGLQHEAKRLRLFFHRRAASC